MRLNAFKKIHSDFFPFLGTIWGQWTLSSSGSLMLDDLNYNGDNNAHDNHVGDDDDDNDDDADDDNE